MFVLVLGGLKQAERQKKRTVSAILVGVSPTSQHDLAHPQRTIREVRPAMQGSRWKALWESATVDWARVARLSSSGLVSWSVPRDKIRRLRWHLPDHSVGPTLQVRMLDASKPLLKYCLYLAARHLGRSRSCHFMAGAAMQLCP